jgi:hypothetical protein
MSPDRNFISPTLSSGQLTYLPGKGFTEQWPAGAKRAAITLFQLKTDYKSGLEYPRRKSA